MTKTKLKQIETAVIPVAGFGTRRLPVTKAIEKCMLPIGNRPLVDYVVEDCAKAGLKRVIFVIGEEAYQLKRYYGRNIQLEKYLTERGKSSGLAMIKETGHGLEFEYVKQGMDLPYGTAVPLQVAKPALAGESDFALLMGDDFVYRADGSSELADALTVWQGNATRPNLIMANSVGSQLVRQGLLLQDDQGRLRRIVEHPDQPISGQALVNISKYLLSSSILKYNDAVLAGPPNPNGEYYFIDVLNQATADGQATTIYTITGQYLDGGNQAGWLKANNIVQS